MKIRAYGLSLLLIILTSPAFTQTKQIELSGHYAAMSDTLFNGAPNHSHGLGANFTFDFSHRLGIDAGFTVYPADTHQLFVGYGATTDFNAGIRFAAVRTRRIGMFAHVRPGLLHFSDLRIEFPEVPPFDPGFPAIPAHTISHGPQTNFAVDLGGTIEWYPSRKTFVRADFGDQLVNYGAFQKTDVVPGDPPITYTADFPQHWKNQYKVSFGFGWRFGTAGEDRVGNPTLSDRRWTLGTHYSTLYIDGWRSGVGVQVSRRIARVVEWGAVANVFPGYDGQDLFFWYGKRILQVQTGPAVQLLGAKSFSLKAHLRPGFLNYNDFIGFNSPNPVSQTEFNLNYGLTAEYNHWKRVPLRLEVSDNLIHHTDTGTPFSILPTWDHAPQVSAGIAFRF